MVLRHPDGRRTIVPVHGTEIVGVGLMSKIQRDVKMEKEEFVRLFCTS